MGLYHFSTAFTITGCGVTFPNEPFVAKKTKKFISLTGAINGVVSASIAFTAHANPISSVGATLPHSSQMQHAPLRQFGTDATPSQSRPYSTAQSIHTTLSFAFSASLCLLLTWRCFFNFAPQIYYVAFNFIIARK